MNKKEISKYIAYIYDKIDYLLKEIYDNNNEFVNETISKFDEETQKFVRDRNKSILKGNFENFILTSIKDKSYKIVTAAMILYNIDNR